MKSELLVLCLETPDPKDSNVVKLAEYLGLTCSIFCLKKNQDPLIPIKKKIEDRDDIFMAVRCKTLFSIFKQTKHIDEIISLFYKNIPFLFIFDFLPGESSNTVLPIISNGAVVSISRFVDSNFEYRVSNSLKEITRELSGRKIGPINDAVDFKFNLSPKSGKFLKKIISINNEGFFIVHKEQQCNIFLAATSKIIDIDSVIEKTDYLRNYFSQFIPLMMFLKYVFKEACWHNENLCANFIIDDPTITKTYGFLSYKKLLMSMYEYNFVSTIAFIPWNYKRTDNSIAKIFLNEKDKLSVCIHGCNHTSSEFGTSDDSYLNRMIKILTERMSIHKQLTGIDFEKIMVFPQGTFSLAAMKSLKGNNFLAAVNSTPYTEDSRFLRIADALDVAIMSHENFPLFTRRYSSDELVDFAIDAFLGKPLLIVEHHNYFKESYAKIGKFVAQINSISEKIKWKRLGDILKTTYVERVGNSGEVYCRIYSNETTVTNKYETDKKFIVQKKETQKIKIKNVFANGKEVAYRIHNEMLEFHFEMKPGEMITVKIDYESDTEPIKIRKNKLEDIKIFCRRYLSEIRDNYICKNDFLFDLVDKTKRKFN